MQIRNPRTGQYDYNLSVDNPAFIHEKVATLRQHQTAWKAAGLPHRISILQQWVERIKVHQDEIVEQLNMDTGRRSIAKTEVAALMGLIQAWSYRVPQLYQTTARRPSATNETIYIEQQWVPYAVVGVISPWNFPLLLAVIDSIPALLAGAAVALKPSEVTPRFMDPLEKSIQEVPALAKVFSLARGGAETGKAIVEQVDAICFTGSVPTGRKIAAACAARFIPAFLELGGKDPAIVLEDADLDLSSDAILRSCVGATGQACQSLERIYVDEKIYPEFLALLTQKAKNVTLTIDPNQGQMGPIIFEKQAEKIQTQIDEALTKGAQLHHGGKVEQINGGFWCLPTILTEVDHQMSVMTEETFGPVIPIMSFSTEEQAIAFANDSIYGLSASVFSKDLDHALRIAQQLEAGAISINDGSLTNRVFDAEKNSFKQSGINGSRMGDAGFLRFFRKKALLIQEGKPATMASFEEGEC